MKNNAHKSLKQSILSSLQSVAALLFVFAALSSCNQTTNSESDYSAIEPPVAFSPDIPVDVDPAIQAKLKQENKIYELNEAFNRYSWQAFMAIQWPVKKDGTPLPKFTDAGDPSWLGWKEAFQVYRADGLKPAPWGAKRTASGLNLPNEALEDYDSRLVLSSSTPTHPDNFNIADEVDQAFAGKLFDQNGNVVVYEVLMNETEFDYVMENALYNKNGQLNYTSTGAIADFPAGDYAQGFLGAVEIKFAWKILEDTDIKSRYFTDEGWVYNAAGKLVKKPIGLIGMHISQKTPTGKQWVWSTFEHIDNLEENVVEIDGKRKVIHPTLRDPQCEICPVNFDATNATTFEYKTDTKGNYWQLKDSTGTNIEGPHTWASEQTMKTQAFRVVDIPVRVENINTTMQAYFAQEGSVWQYYRLIDTQYPLDQNALPGPHGKDDNTVPESVVNKPGGNPNLALLTNITMETFFQLGNQSGSNLMEGNPPNGTQIFGSESCMGCHSSAGMYTWIDGNATKNSGQLSGDFSWLLGKAQWDSSTAKPSAPSGN